MATRNEWTMEIECPDCGNDGDAQVSEDDHPFIRHGNFNVDGVSPTFSIVRSSRYRKEIEIKCDECGRIFKLVG